MRIWLAALLTLTGAAQAEGIHQCRGADGKVAFSDKPCAGGTTGSLMKLSTPVTYGSKEATEGFKDMDKMFSESRRRDELEARQRERAERREVAQRRQQATPKARPTDRTYRTVPPSEVLATTPPAQEQAAILQQRLPAPKKEAPAVIDTVACGNAQRMFNATDRSNGVNRTFSTNSYGRAETAEVVNLQQRARYDEVTRTCGKAPEAGPRSHWAP